MKTMNIRIQTSCAGLVGLRLSIMNFNYGVYLPCFYTMTTPKSNLSIEDPQAPKRVTHSIHHKSQLHQSLGKYLPVVRSSQQRPLRDWQLTCVPPRTLHAREEYGTDVCITSGAIKCVLRCLSKLTQCVCLSMGCCIRLDNALRST